MAVEAMKARIEILPEKKLIGLRMRMTLADDKTRELWRSFMARRNEITNRVSADLISMQVYNPSFDFTRFDLNAPFEKWAAAEVTEFMVVPSGMDSFVLPGGLYAVFVHIGGAKTGERKFRYIFGTCLPNSEYAPDDRPHFEVLGEKYRNDDPESEEEVWIPIRAKKLAKK